jgi:hypothetical protein
MSRSIDAAVSLNAGLQCRIGDASNGILSKTRDQWLEGRKEKHAVRAEMPHFKLDANFKLMSDDERQEATVLLREMLARLSMESVAGLPPVRLTEA